MSTKPSFQLDTNHTNWQIPIDSDQLAITSNSTYVFTVISETERCSPDSIYCDTVQISSYDMNSGEIIWSVYHHGMDNAETLCANDEFISIRGHATRSDVWNELSLAVDTGEVVPYQDVCPGPAYERIGLDVYQLGFDKGDILDDYEIEGDYLFFLTSNESTLWAINRNTSQIVGQIKFEDAPFGSGKDYIGQFAISADKNIVVVYFGDHNQLFVFRLLPEN